MGTRDELHSEGLSEVKFELWPKIQQKRAFQAVDMARRKAPRRDDFGYLKMRRNAGF